MEKGVIQPQGLPVPDISDIVGSEKSFTRSMHWEGRIIVPVMFDGRLNRPEYSITYDRFFKEANGTPRQEYHNLHVTIPYVSAALPLFPAYPTSAVDLIIEKSVVKSPEKNSELTTNDFYDWFVQALRRNLPTRVLKGISNGCIKGL